MAVLHKEFIGFNKNIKLTENKRQSLITSRNELRRKIKTWFKTNQPNELQPKFSSQGSFAMNTIINPIVQEDEDGKKFYKYDLDDGVYFIETGDEDNKRGIHTWHDWIYDAVDNHTGEPTIRKTTCIRVVFADGHHIDIPIYYKNSGEIELAHKAKGWLLSDPKEFYQWFNSLKTTQLERLVRYLKAWKNYRESNNTNLVLPSGFALTILATNNYVAKDNDDESLLETVRSICSSLNSKFECIRPTTPVGEDVFENYSDSKRINFLNTLDSLMRDLERAKNENNFKKASEILVNNQFGNRFPIGEDCSSEQKSSALQKSIFGAAITPKPYGY
mgnify:CR=1 FL=1